MVIVCEKDYKSIIEFLSTQKGFLIEYEKDLVLKFPHIPLNTLRAIISKYGQNVIKEFYSKNHRRAQTFLNEYEQRARNEWTIVEMALEMKIPPLCVGRMILNEKFSKSEVKEIMKDPNIISDPLLSANVFTCIFNDNQDGPIIDMMRYSIGEEYEVRLKILARNAGLTFYDEGDLRRDGFDKTPDILLAIQCLYKGNIISWIESKASFGDTDSHSRYLKDQLSSYTNRFGSGLIIYWFGFHQEILTTSKSNIITILDDFPSRNDFVKLTFEK